MVSMNSMKSMFSSITIWRKVNVPLLSFSILCLKGITISMTDLLLWKNLIRISSKKNCSSSLISRRYSRYMISNTTVLWFNSIIDRRVEFLWNMHWLYPSSRNKVSIIISSSFQWFQTTILDYLIILLYHFYQLIINSQKSSGSMRKLLGWEKENGLMKC